MANVTYDKEITALLVVDPYNDFISEGGKIWGCIRAVAEANDCVSHMLQVLNAARKVKLRVSMRCIIDAAPPSAVAAWGTRLLARQSAQATRPEK